VDQVFSAIKRFPSSSNTQQAAFSALQSLTAGSRCDASVARNIGLVTSSMGTQPPAVQASACELISSLSRLQGRYQGCRVQVGTIEDAEYRWEPIGGMVPTPALRVLLDKKVFAGQKKHALVRSDPADGSLPFVNAADVNGKIAVCQRGNSTFMQKADNAQSAGAIGMIVVNNDTVFTESACIMGQVDDATMPMFMISFAAGKHIQEGSVLQHCQDEVEEEDERELLKCLSENGVVQKLVGSMQACQKNTGVILAACDALYKTANMPEFLNIAIQSGALECLLKTMELHPQDPEVAWAACRALLNITVIMEDFDRTKVKPGLCFHRCRFLHFLRPRSAFSMQKPTKHCSRFSRRSTSLTSSSC
jgi:hypothetical protein